MRPLRARPQRAGMSLLETLISVALLGTVVGSTMLVQRSSASTFEDARDRAAIDAKLRRALDRVSMELIGAAAGELTPDPTGDGGESTVAFRRPIGLDEDGDLVFGEWTRLELLPDDGDPLNGVDDDGDGLVDEHALWLVRAAGTAAEQRVVLLRGIPPLFEGELPGPADDNGNGLVDEAGFHVRRVGEALSLRLSLQGRAAGRAVFTRSLETTLRLRN